MDNSCPLQPKQKLFKEQRNLCRKQDGETDKRTEKAKKQLTERHGEEEEEEERRRRPIVPQHVVQVDVEINIVDSVDICNGQKTPSHQVKPCSKRKSTTPQRARRKPHVRTAAAADVPSPAPTTVPSSPSQASVISETAAEELCDLRNYYSKQLRRINYISHEYLQPAEPGVLACIREPLRSLRLPRRVTIAKTARSLWTRVSGRRKLFQQ